jgi:hypothetical protein
MAADDKTFDSSDFLDDGDDDESLLGGDPETDAILGKSDGDDVFSFDDEDPSIDLQPDKNVRDTKQPSDNDQESYTIDDTEDSNQGDDEQSSMIPKLTIQGQDDYSSLDDLDDDYTAPQQKEMKVPDLNAVKIPEPKPAPREDQGNLNKKPVIAPNNDSSDERVPVNQYDTVPLNDPNETVSYGQVESTTRNDRDSNQTMHIVPAIPNVIVDDGRESTIDVDLVRKIIFVIDNYRHLDKGSQKTVVQFIRAISYVKGRRIENLDESSIVKEVIETDPDIRAGVHNLLDAKERDGADRAFFLMGLDSSSLKNIDLFLRLTGTTKDELVVKDESLASIKRAAEVLNGLLDKLNETQVVYIKKLDDILQSTEKVMKS